jgi:signal transduction histidine kinase
MVLIDVPAALALVSSVVCFLAAGIVFIRRERRPQAAGVLLIYLSVSFIWFLEQALRRMGQLDFLLKDFLDLVPFYGVLILAITFFFLTRALLDSRTSGLRWSLVGLIWLAVLIIMDTNWLSMPSMLAFRGGWMISRQSLSFVLLIGGWAVFIGGATILTTRALRGTSRYYTSVSYWVMVLILMVAGDGLFYADQTMLGGSLRLAATLLATYVILAPRLPDISHIMRHSLGYSIFVLLAIGLYTIGLVSAQLIFPGWEALNPIWVGLILAMVLVFLFYPVLARIHKILNGWMTRSAADSTNLLRKYSQSITNLLDLDLLASLCVNTTSLALKAKRGFLFLVDFEKGEDGFNIFQLRGVKGTQKTTPLPGRLREECSLALYFRQEYKPVTQHDLDFNRRFRDLTSQERGWLANLGAEVYTPIYAKNEWIGLLTLGPKDSGAAYTGEDLALLTTIADQTAVALENTRLVEGLVRLNDEFRRAYAALDQANRHLERLDKTKSDFISISSHELRTPLTLISGSSQMLLDEPDLQANAYYKQLLSKIQIGAQRLHEVVDSMLDIAKIDTRALELEQKPVSMNELIHSVCKELRSAAQERRQTIEMQDLDALPPITADAESLRKVFYHLVVNAIKYTPNGGKITISGQALEPNLSDLPRGGVEIVVSDTGIGIDPRYHELIFVKFYQTGELALHSSGKTKFKGGGPGLGLAIARGIIQAHHGRIWVESAGYDEVGCPGSQFHVVLPLRQTESPQPPQKISMPD